MSKQTDLIRKILDAATVDGRLETAVSALDDYVEKEVLDFCLLAEDLVWQSTTGIRDNYRRYKEANQ